MVNTAQATKQKELLERIAALEHELALEDEVAKNDVVKLEKQCLALEYQIKELENGHESMLQDQYLERIGEQKRQEKKIELADKLIGELKKEHKKLQKQKTKYQTKFDKIDTTSQKIEGMNNSLSSLYESASSLNDIHETKYGSLQEEHDATRELNKDIKNKLRQKQDMYWEVAQSRLEYQKGMAKILTLVQDHINSGSTNETMNEAATQMTKIAMEVENEAKIEMAALDIETAGTDIMSSTTYTEVSEAPPSSDSDAYLEINLAPTRRGSGSSKQSV